jgi:hypothetical protein
VKKLKVLHGAVRQWCNSGLLRSSLAYVWVQTPDCGMLSTWASLRMLLECTNIPVQLVHRAYLLTSKSECQVWLKTKVENVWRPVNISSIWVLRLSQYNDKLWAVWPDFDSCQEQEIFVCSSVSRLTLGSTQPPDGYSKGKRQGHEADHWLLSVARVKSGGAVMPTGLWVVEGPTFSRKSPHR